MNPSHLVPTHFKGSLGHVFVNDLREIAEKIREIDLAAPRDWRESIARSKKIRFSHFSEASGKHVPILVISGTRSSLCAQFESGTARDLNR